MLKRPTVALAVVPATVLAITNAWSAIWPVFCATKQVIAALALILIVLALYSGWEGLCALRRDAEEPVVEGEAEVA